MAGLVGSGPRAAAADTDALRHASAWCDDLDDQVLRLRDALASELASASRRATEPCLGLPPAWVLDDIRQGVAQSRQLNGWVRGVASAFELADQGGPPLPVDVSEPVRGRLPTPQEQERWDTGRLAGRAVVDALDRGDEHGADDALAALADLDDVQLWAALGELGDLERIEDRLIAAARDESAPWRFLDGVAQMAYDTLDGAAWLAGSTVDADTRATVVSGLAHAATHPVDALAVAADVDGLRRDPWQWAGGVTAAAAAAVMTVGGTAAGRSALANLRGATTSIGRLRALGQLRAVLASTSAGSRFAGLAGYGSRLEDQRRRDRRDTQRSRPAPGSA